VCLCRFYIKKIIDFSYACICNKSEFLWPVLIKLAMTSIDRVSSEVSCSSLPVMVGDF
jgi:hypothetical protein